MTVHLPKELERFVQKVVRAGHYAREDDVIREALILLRKTMPDPAAPTRPNRKRAQPVHPKKPLTKDEFHRYLLEIGLMSQLPDREADFDDPDDQPVDIKGEPLSETIIRERR